MDFTSPEFLDTIAERIEVSDLHFDTDPRYSKILFKAIKDELVLEKVPEQSQESLIHKVAGRLSDRYQEKHPEFAASSQTREQFFAPPIEDKPLQSSTSNFSRGPKEWMQRMKRGRPQTLPEDFPPPRTYNDLTENSKASGDSLAHLDELNPETELK